MAAEEPPLISREAAHLEGKRFYYPGTPCVNGHMSIRYVSTGGCVECLKKFKPRRNPFSKDLVPMDMGKLWRSRRLTYEQLISLKNYLQECVRTFEAHVLPPLCKRCDGTRYVPVGAGSGGQWKLCPDCPDHIPSTADTQGQQIAPAAANGSGSSEGESYT